MTFYKFSNAQKTVVSNDDWHLAVSIRPTQFPDAPLGGTTIRYNQAFGVTVYYVPNAGAADFSNLDTTGYRSWSKLYDSDTELDEGAFNGNRSGIYDFGWGVYNAFSHDVVGDSLFLVKLPNGQLKKFLVVNLSRDTAFNIRYADIDNSNLQNVHIAKANYSGKSFVYLNMANNTVMDKEPLKANWDIQFLKYSASDILSSAHVGVVGVWLNKGDSAAARRGVDVADNNYANLSFSGKLNAIGWNWKNTGSYNALLSGKNTPDFIEFYEIQDSLAYFVKTADNEIYKLVFTDYRTGNGRINFYSQKMGSVTAINEVDKAPAVLGIYPNPSSSVLNVVLASANAEIKVFDIGGRLTTQLTAVQNRVELNTSDYANGIYLLQVTVGGRTSTNRFVVNH